MINIIKGIASKSIFALGLGTASYYSYGQVQQWVKHDKIQIVENLVQKHVTRENVVYDESYVPQEVSYEQPSVGALVASEEAPVAVPAVAAAEEKKADDEKKPEDGEKKEGEENTEVAGGVIGQPLQNSPMAYAPQGPAPASTNTENNQAIVNNDVPLALAATPSPAPSGSSSSGSSFTSGSSISYTPASVSGLDQADIAALISPMKANFDDETNYPNGLLCSVQEGRNTCERRNHVPVHSLRWGMSEGLKKDVKFSIKSAGGTAVEFAFDFKIQNQGLVEEAISITARPSEILVHNQFIDSKNYRVFKFKFADLTVRGEVINNVKATLAYEVTQSGLVLSGDSELSFTRANITSLTTKWEPLAGEPTDPVLPVADVSVARTLREPAATQSGVFLIADSLFFSMSVEKSQ